MESSLRERARRGVLATLLPLCAAAPAGAVAPLEPASALVLETRYEHATGPIRPGTRGDDQILTNRTELRFGTARSFGSMRLGAQFELWDTRAFLHDAETPLDTGEVNALEPVNAWLALEGRFGTFRAGRLTQDLGSRRLVARNLYRATTNTFTGLDWRGTAGPWSVLAFAYSPDARRPDERDRVRNDDFQLDEATLERLFYGVFGQRELAGAGTLELYLYHLDENDTDETPSRNRRITTPGLRWRRPAPEGGLDAELELALQFGKLRATRASTDTRDLDHLAGLVHAELGWRPSARGPRTSLEIAWASGDDDPGDGDSGTFDSLFGVIVGDYGPSGIWTSLNRRNLLTAAVRVEGRPHPDVRVHALLRHVRLAEARDAWYAAGLRDRSGGAGDEVGQQFETRARWWAVEDHLRIETGWVHFEKGDFARRAPAAPDDDAVDYFWFTTRIIL